jgi:WhiB family redox-sensing transcriptional regulator
MTAVTIHLGQPATDAWQHQAACIGLNPELWHPLSYDSTVGKVQTDIAISICHQCPAKAACLNDALEREGGTKAESRHGTWGGTTPNDRYNMAKRDQRHRLRAAA